MKGTWNSGSRLAVAALGFCLIAGGVTGAQTPNPATVSVRTESIVVARNPWRIDRRVRVAIGEQTLEFTRSPEQRRGSLDLSAVRLTMSTSVRWDECRDEYGYPVYRADLSVGGQYCGVRILSEAVLRRDKTDGSWEFVAQEGVSGAQNVELRLRDRKGEFFRRVLPLTRAPVRGKKAIDIAADLVYRLGEQATLQNLTVWQGGKSLVSGKISEGGNECEFVYSGVNPEDDDEAIQRQKCVGLSSGPVRVSFCISAGKSESSLTLDRVSHRITGKKTTPPDGRSAFLLWVRLTDAFSRKVSDAPDAFSVDVGISPSTAYPVGSTVCGEWWD